METKEFKVSVPEGYEIDRENSTFECIKFKCIEEPRFRDDTKFLMKGYSIDGEYWGALTNLPSNYDTFATKKQAKSALAMARISQIMANDKRFGGFVTDEEWNNTDTIKYSIKRYKNICIKDVCSTLYKFLSFHTREQRNLFMEENMDLIKDYLMID